MRVSVGTVMCSGGICGDTIGALVFEHTFMLLLLSGGVNGG